MANYYGIGRTNYFRVKDEAAFEKAVGELCGIELTSERRDEFNAKWYCLLDDNQGGGGWNVYKDDDLEEPVAFEDWLPEHLLDGDVAIIMEGGHEKYRYINGWALAINSKGETRSVNLDDIYDIAREELGDTITLAQY